MFSYFVSTTVKFVLGVYAGYKILDFVTLWVEQRRRDKSDRNSWDLMEKDLYAESELIEVRDGRRLCVLRLPRVNVQARAEGVMFFIHGSMARLSQFKDQITYFRQVGYNVIAYDYFGMGRSPKESMNPGDYSTDEHTADLLRLYELFLGGDSQTQGSDLHWVRGPVHIVGNSFGCSQALRLSHHVLLNYGKSQNILRSVTLLGSGIPSPGKMKQARRIFSLPLWILRLLHPLLSSGFKDRALHPDTVKGNEAGNLIHIRLLKFSEAVSGANPMHVVQPFYLQMQQIDELTARSVAKMAKEHNVKILMLTGEADKLTTVKSCKELAGTWLAQADPKIVILPLASHQVMQEQPEKTNKLIMEFVQGSCTH